MTRSRSVTFVLAFALATALTSACNGGESPRPTKSTTAASQTESPTAMPSAEPSTAPVPGAGEAVVELWSVIDRVAADPTSSIDDLSSVASSQALAQWYSNLTDMRAKGWTSHGKTSVEILDVKAPSTGSVFQVETCVDVSQVNVVDLEGKSVLAPDRSIRSEQRYEVTRDGDRYLVTRYEQLGVMCP